MKKLIKTIFNILLLFSLSFAQQPQWRLASGTEDVHIAAITIYPNNPDTLYAIGSWFFRSADRGEHWDSLSAFGAAGGALKTDPFNSNIIYASSTIGPAGNNIIDISTDGGQTWTSVLAGTGLCPEPVFIEIDPKNKKTVYVGVGSAQVWRSSDYGQTWVSVAIPQYCIFDFKIAPSNDSIIYSAHSAGIYKSKNKGNSWSQTAFSTGAHFLAVHPLNPDIVYTAISAGDPRGVYKTMDGGQTWKQMNNGLDSLQGYDWINTIVINPEEPEELYLGTNDVFKTTDGGNNWFMFTQGMGSRGHVTSITIDTLNDRIYAGTGRGIYIYDGLTTSIDTKTLQTPKEFLLYQNYPNPFNSSTIIAYTLSERSFVNLIVYDLMGKEVITLVNEKQTGISYQVVWNGRNKYGKEASSGV
ncbi:MAG: hypothetical protein KKG93_20440, partial [Bacteroidetes bacterium]|nr:hypothetical protein [Bacteroidota bacterium]